MVDHKDHLIMEKLKLSILSLMIACSCLLAQAQTGLRPRGDVNCDWEVNIADVKAVIDSIFAIGMDEGTVRSQAETMAAFGLLLPDAKKSAGNSEKQSGK